MATAPDSIDNVYIDRSKILAGRGLFVKDVISQGSLVFSRARAAIAAVDSAHLEETCSNCYAWCPGESNRTELNTPVDLKRCQACKSTRYCSRACQVESWTHVHKYECKIYAALLPRILPTTIRALFQILLIREKSQSSKDDWNALQALESHRLERERRGGGSWDDVVLMSKGAQKYSGTSLTEEEVRTLHCIVLINSLTLTTPALSPIGMCLDPLAASINHSCDPNSFIIFDGPRMSVRSRRQIKKGEEVTISYIDSSEPFQRRQSDLKERYFFTCNCSKCQLGSTLREDRFLPGNGDEPDLRAIENKSFALVQESKKTEDIGLAIAMLQEAEKLLKEDSRGRWPIDRQPWPELLVEMHLKLLSAGEFMQAFPYALKMYFDTDPLLYPEPWHPQRVVRNASLSQLVVQLSVMAEDDATLSRVLKGYKLDMGLIVWALMNELRANVVKSHGAESQFAKMIQLKREQLGIDLTRVPAEAANHTKGAQWLEREWTNLRQFVSAANDSPQS